MLGLLLLALQQGLPTVGDTVWITRTYPVRQGLVVRPRSVAATGVAEPLGLPEVIQTAGEVRLRYALVVWQPGRHRIEVPGPVLVRSDGWSDTLGSAAVEIEVASVLPPGSRDSIEARPPLAAVEQSRRSLMPAAVLVGLVALPLGLLHRWWRRRGARLPPRCPAAPTPPPDLQRLAAWAEAGEYRAAAEGLKLRLAAVSDAEAGARVLVGRLEAVRFAGSDDPELARACAEARVWLETRELR